MCHEGVCNEDPAAHSTIRSHRHQFVAVHGQPEGELYDLEVDPRETRNLCSDPDHAEVRSAMLQRLCDRMAWTVDPLPPRQTNW